jgi:hypothetical protein
MHTHRHTHARAARAHPRPISDFTAESYSLVLLRRFPRTEASGQTSNDSKQTADPPVGFSSVQKKENTIFSVHVCLSRVPSPSRGLPGRLSGFWTDPNPWSKYRSRSSASSFSSTTNYPSRNQSVCLPQIRVLILHSMRSLRFSECSRIWIAAGWCYGSVRAERESVCKLFQFQSKGSIRDSELAQAGYVIRWLLGKLWN